MDDMDKVDPNFQVRREACYTRLRALLSGTLINDLHVPCSFRYGNSQLAVSHHDICTISIDPLPQPRPYDSILNSLLLENELAIDSSVHVCE